MRILIHDHGGYPFPAQLARKLAERGHDVLYLHAGGWRAPRGAFDRRPDDPATLNMESVGLRETLIRHAGPRRLLQERRYAKLLAAQIRSHHPDVVLSGTGPLDAHSSAQRAAHAGGAAFVFWLQDVYSIAIGRLLGRRLPMLGRVSSVPFTLLERRLLRTSDAVVATSIDFLPLLRRWHVPEERTTVVENWAPLDEVLPLPKRNAWAVRYGLADTPVFLYAGTLGRKHDPGLLVALADAMPNAQVVVVSDGVGTDLLHRLKEGRLNILLLPLQPPADLPEVLASADVLVALLEHEAHAFSVPSKVLTYLTAGRPILGAIPEANLAARTIREAGAGAVVDPLERDDFVSAARRLLADAPARTAAGHAARAYAEQKFNIETITDRFESIFEAARRRRRSRLASASDTAGSSLDTPPEAEH
jgi:glycosyltransferase involved in cell wall biosynthesis